MVTYLKYCLKNCLDDKTKMNFKYQRKVAVFIKLHQVVIAHKIYKNFEKKNSKQLSGGAHIFAQNLKITFVYGMHKKKKLRRGRSNVDDSLLENCFLS